MLTPIAGMKESDNHAWYPGDSGMDVAAPKGTPVRAVDDGILIYSERGHTPWGTSMSKPFCHTHDLDTPNCILLKLDRPIVKDGKTYPLVWYCHLSSLAYEVPDDGAHYRHVKAGEYLGKTGLGNGNGHLHFGILINRDQAEGHFMKPEQIAELEKQAELHEAKLVKFW